MLTKRSVMKKTREVGGLTLLSRLLGLAREILMGHYLGAGIISDAFFTAFKIPNSLRKIFAEGALSVSFVPTFVKLIKKNGKQDVNRLMSLALIIFEGVLVLLCLLILWKADWVIRFIVPGWYETTECTRAPSGIGFIDGIVQQLYTVFWCPGNPSEQVFYAITFLRILIFFILFLSMSALVAGALQAVHHFLVPAFGPVLLNIFFITGLVVCLAKGLPATYLCAFIMLGAAAQFLMHVAAYWRLGFAFSAIDAQAWQNLKEVFEKFFPCLLAMSIMEIHLFISTSLGSYLPKGSISLIYYANRFMQIPLGVFATALSTVLLPFFSRVGVYAPKRLSFYLYETTKLVLWVTVPIALFMGFVSEKIFYTLFLSKKFTLAQVQEAGMILLAFLLGLFFFSLNRILLNLYYALHETRTPMYITIVSTIVNFIASCYLFMPLFGATGIALGTTVSGITQTALSIFLLWYKFDFVLYVKRFLSFCMQFAVQLVVVSGFFLGCYRTVAQLIGFMPNAIEHKLLYTVFYWVWVIPIAALSWFLLSHSRRYFGIRLYFLD